MTEATRRDLSHRVREFRSRRLPGSLPLQFEEPPTAGETQAASKVVAFHETPAATSALPARIAPPPRLPKHTPPRVEQPELAFPALEMEPDCFLGLPVAPFELRMLGHAADFGLSLAAFLLFLIAFKLLADPVEFSKVVLAGIGLAYALVALLYGVLFLCMAGATPSMKWLGLRLVNFDGLPPARQQLLYRLLGAIVSVGSFFLGFLWAAVDEEKLSWHDRISKTFLTVSQQRPEDRA